MVMDGRDQNGVHVGPLPVLRGILRTWVKLIDLDEWDAPGDAPWWYNERALLSLFAGAVWQHGGWAFEEYATSKLQSKRARYAGRGDLMFSIGRRATRFVAEAKVCSPSIGPGTDPLRQIERVLDTACRDVAKAREAGYRPLGLVFVAPCVKTTQVSHASAGIAGMLRGVKELAGTGWAWNFPAAGRRIKADGYVYPGGMMIIRPLGRS
jgi:hypothetical protein